MNFIQKIKTIPHAIAAKIIVTLNDAKQTVKNNDGAEMVEALAITIIVLVVGALLLAAYKLEFPKIIASVFEKLTGMFV